MGFFLRGWLFLLAGAQQICASWSMSSWRSAGLWLLCFVGGAIAEIEKSKLFLIEIRQKHSSWLSTVFFSYFFTCITFIQFGGRICLMRHFFKYKPLSITLSSVRQKCTQRRRFGSKIVTVYIQRSREWLLWIRACGKENRGSAIKGELGNNIRVVGWLYYYWMGKIIIERSETRDDKKAFPFFSVIIANFLSTRVQEEEFQFLLWWICNIKWFSLVNEWNWKKIFNTYRGKSLIWSDLAGFL